MFKSVKLFLRNYFFKKELQRRHRIPGMVSFEQAVSIGIIFNMFTEEDFRVMGRFIKRLQEQGKKVKSIALNGEKIVPPYYNQTLTQDIILKSEISWLSFPKAPFVTEFIDNHFDILFDFSLQSNFQVFYIATLSNARFKIGLNHEDNIPYFDLMIGLENDSTLEMHIESTMFYLEQIKPINP